MTAQDDRRTVETLGIGIRHHVAGRLPEAEALYRSVLSNEPSNAEALHLLGLIAHQIGDHESAVKTIEDAIALDSTKPTYLNNVGEAYTALNRLDEAEVSYRRALAMNPNYADAHNNLANVLRQSKKLDEAEQHYLRAMELQPGLARIRLNYALLKLLRGDYKTGFQYFESRFEGADRREIGADLTLLKTLKIPRWTGAPLAGESLLIWTEQGLGDSLMMMRYLTLLKSRGAGHVTVYCHKPLVRIIRSLDSVDEVICRDIPLPSVQCQWQCPMMSLPLIFESSLDTLPHEIPYLVVPNQLRKKWAATVAKAKGPRIGLVWAGGRHTGTDPRRSISLEKFASLVEIPGVNFISVQKGQGMDQGGRVSRRLLDWMDKCDDLMETAALIDQLDLVVSVDTSVAHLAGALGKPVWLLNRFESEWRWMLERVDSPWYPTMRIFSQSRRDVWEDVIDRVGSAVRLEYVLANASRESMPTVSTVPRAEASLWQRWLSKIRT